MRKFKNIAAVLTAIILVLAAVPVQGFADGTFAEKAGLDISVTERESSGSYDASNAVCLYPDDDLTITAEGVYILCGEYKNQMILVDAAKEDKVQIVLENAVIANSSGPAVYVKSADKVFITAAAGTESSISDGSQYAMTDGETEVDAAVFSKDDLVINGSGKLTISGNMKHAVVSKDDLIVTAKDLTVTAVSKCLCGKESVVLSDASADLQAGTDGIRSDEYVAISGGTVNISASEGIEGTYILIAEGKIIISATDDGINAAKKSDTLFPLVEITGGTISISMRPGDTDGIDVNGDIIISGGVIDITGSSSFDYDGAADFAEGTVYVNGRIVSELPNQMVGGFGMMPGEFGGRGMSGDGRGWNRSDAPGQGFGGEPPMGRGEMRNDMP